MRLTINTETDTYEQAIAAVQAAYGKRPAVPVDWPEAPAVEPMPDPQDLGDDVIKDGWSEQMLFQVIAALMPRAREVIRRVVDVGGTATYDSVQQYFAPAIPRSKIGGTLTSVQAVVRRLGPDNRAKLLQRDEQARVYRIDRKLLEPLRRVFALADARTDLLRGGPSETTVT
ncbi:hypothetical protein ABVB69_34960 [Streptomyces sp. NPDC000349]|uniref:hypothetical protein n=1 Tax=unclassified Streptomyces TaxID=2593676 RepID=UPI00278B58CC|nr:hypothetical protein [Streptomyces sp. DSM 40167]MDQ0408681.1 hypothetical protein [Streptomyces sp. DSM 40167]